MAKKKADPKPGRKPAKKETEPGKELNIKAHDLANKDIETDPDLNSKPRPENDLDEGELSRFEGED